MGLTQVHLEKWSLKRCVCVCLVMVVITGAKNVQSFSQNVTINKPTPSFLHAGRPSWRRHWTRAWHHDLNQGLLVMCSETVGLRTIPVWDQKKIGLGLAGLVLCWKTRSCYAHRHNDLEGHSNFSNTIYSFSLFCAWNITTVEINSGVHSLKS